MILYKLSCYILNNIITSIASCHNNITLFIVIKISLDVCLFRAIIVDSLGPSTDGLRATKG